MPTYKAFLHDPSTNDGTRIVEFNAALIQGSPDGGTVLGVNNNEVVFLAPASRLIYLAKLQS